MDYTNRLLETWEMLKLVAENPGMTIEARLILGEYRATHFITYKKGKIHDMGIDSEWRKTDFVEFYNDYKAQYWEITSIY